MQHQVYTVEQASRVPLDTEMLYVKTLLQLAYIATLKSAGGIHLAATRPAGGTDLLSKESVAKLERKKQQQELTLKITQSWTPDMAEYQVGVTTCQNVSSVSLAIGGRYNCLWCASQSSDNFMKHCQRRHAYTRLSVACVADRHYKTYRKLGLVQSTVTFCLTPSLMCCASLRPFPSLHLSQSSGVWLRVALFVLVPSCVHTCKPT